MDRGDFFLGVWHLIISRVQGYREKRSISGLGGHSHATPRFALDPEHADPGLSYTSFHTNGRGRQFRHHTLQLRRSKILGFF